MNTLDNLTERELEILEILSKGMPNKEIANFLGISENTVEQHLQNIYKKLNVHNRTEAAALFLKGKNES
jgi:RNA polymerase sigma factor (sigma-70 family)